MKSIVIGANGGLGRALADALAARGEVTRITRRSTPSLDLLDDASIAAAAEALRPGSPYEAILLATGILHDNAVRPEKSLRDIDGAVLERLFRINAIGPAVVMRHFLPLLARDRRALFAVLSARVGSIGDNRLGGWVGYRASKAALNQIVRTLSIEVARTMPQTIVVGLHPGTVDTPLSKPFQGNVSAGTLLTPADSAAHLLRTVGQLTPADSGGCFDWAGDRIAP